MRFRIATLLLATACVAILARVVLALGFASALFYFTPLAIAAAGAFVGRFAKRAALGAIVSTSVFGLYVLTIPLVEQFGHEVRWPFGSLRLYEGYCVPFYAWAGTIGWFGKPWYTWCTFCDMVPFLAVTILVVVVTIAIGIGVQCGRVREMCQPDRLSLRRTSSG